MSLIKFNQIFYKNVLQGMLKIESNNIRGKKRRTVKDNGMSVSDAKAH